MSDTDISDEAVEEATGKVWKEWFSLLDDWPSASTLQVRINESGAGGGTIVFHHEQIPTEELREAMRVHWTDVLAGLREAA